MVNEVFFRDCLPVTYKTWAKILTDTILKGSEILDFKRMSAKHPFAKKCFNCSFFQVLHKFWWSSNLQENHGFIDLTLPTASHLVHLHKFSVKKFHCCHIYSKFKWIVVSLDFFCYLSFFELSSWYSFNYQNAQFRAISAIIRDKPEVFSGFWGKDRLLPQTKVSGKDFKVLKVQDKRSFNVHLNKQI